MSALCIRWPKYWSFSFTNSPANKYSELISFRTDWGKEKPELVNAFVSAIAQKFTTLGLLLLLSCLSHVRLCATTPWTAARQAPLPLGFSRQECWSCHALLQEILLTQGSNLGLLHCRQILYLWATRGAHTGFNLPNLNQQFFLLRRIYQLKVSWYPLSLYLSTSFPCITLLCP